MVDKNLNGLDLMSKVLAKMTEYSEFRSLDYPLDYSSNCMISNGLRFVVTEIQIGPWSCTLDINPHDADLNVITLTAEVKTFDVATVGFSESWAPTVLKTQISMGDLFSTGVPKFEFTLSFEVITYKGLKVENNVQEIYKVRLLPNKKVSPDIS